MFKKLIAFGILLAINTWTADWSETRIEIFKGSGYGVPFGDGPNHTEEDLTVFSFTHASTNTYGGNFYFFDAEFHNDIQVDDPKFNPNTTPLVTYYGEWSPKFMYGSITGQPLEMGIVKDLGLTGTLEFAPKEVNRLVGAHVALKVPGFVFFDVMPLLRDDPSKPGVTFQLTSAWLVAINLGPLSATFDGFVDYTLDEGKEAGRNNYFSKSYIHAQPAFFIDLGKYLDKAGMLSVGVEYRYWKNKYGIPGLDESVPQFGVRSVF